MPSPWVGWAGRAVWPGRIGRIGRIVWTGALLLSVSLTSCGSSEDAEREGPDPAQPSASEPAPSAETAPGPSAAERLGTTASEATAAATAKAEEAWAAIEELYAQAKSAGETVPDDIVQWTKDDIGRIGDWEYRIESLPADRDGMQKQLNTWGADRWEAYWVELDATGYTVHLKRPARSYLRLIPVGDVLKALPAGGGNGN